MAISDLCGGRGEVCRGGEYMGQGKVEVAILTLDILVSVVNISNSKISSCKD